MVLIKLVAERLKRWHEWRCRGGVGAGLAIVGTLHSCHTCLTFRRADEAGVDEGRLTMHAILH